MSRLIDADKLISEMDKFYKSKKNVVNDNLAEGFMQMESVIKKQPTAFDCDKVIEQLEGLKYTEEDKYDRSINEQKQMCSFNIGMKRAIAIIRKGGINE